MTPANRLAAYALLVLAGYPRDLEKRIEEERADELNLSAPRVVLVDIDHSIPGTEGPTYFFESIEAVLGPPAMDILFGSNDFQRDMYPDMLFAFDDSTRDRFADTLVLARDLDDCIRGNGYSLLENRFARPCSRLPSSQVRGTPAPVHRRGKRGK